MAEIENYESFLSSLCATQWKRIGARRRSGVVTPLFSVYSERSVGIGEIPDLKGLVDWCVKTGLSIIQLLPMNDVGFNFRPYDAESSFALDPMYLSLGDTAFVPLKRFAEDIAAMRKKFLPSAKVPLVDYGVKKEKIELLRRFFDARLASGQRPFAKFVRENRFWLDAYAAFRVIKDWTNQAGWVDWPEDFKQGGPSLVKRLLGENKESMQFYQWLQWQLFCQFADAKKYATAKGVVLLGDLPFLVSRDSADVWAHKDYFKLDRAAGAPPDLYFADGQKWGMPPYHWENIASGGYDYLIQKLQYAENFYDLFRIDHFVGVFRVWTLPMEGSDGTFDPSDETVWDAHGRQIVSVMTDNTAMLPCAEDLGTVPLCSDQVLADYAIPGMDIQRWAKDWTKTFEFKKPAEYRLNGIATMSTHDMSAFAEWWEFETGTTDELFFKKKCELHGIAYTEVAPKLFEKEQPGFGRLRWRNEIDTPEKVLWILGKPKEEIGDMVDLYLGSYGEKQKFWSSLGLSGKCPEKATPALVEGCLQAIGAARSVFTIQILQDFLALGEIFGKADRARRINTPGIVNDSNWRLRMPIALEDMLKLPLNKTIKSINKKTNRI